MTFKFLHQYLTTMAQIQGENGTSLQLLSLFQPASSCQEI